MGTCFPFANVPHHANKNAGHGHVVGMVKLDCAGLWACGQQVLHGRFPLGDAAA